MEIIVTAILAVLIASVVAHIAGYGKLPRLDEPVENSEHKFGEAGTYFRVDVIDADGDRKVAFFTEAQIQVAIDRAARNPEDH